MKERPHLVPCLIVAAMLIGAIAFDKWPYGYYQILRFAVRCLGLFIGILCYNCKNIWGTWLFIGMAIGFPPEDVDLSRQSWQIIDVICVALCFFAAIKIKKPNKELA